ERPDAVVCTHFLPVESLSPVRGGGRCPAPLYCVITDFTAHPFWAFPHVDRYFVASARVADELAGHGVSPARIEVTGIPVDPRFTEEVGRDAARARLGLDPERPMVLVMGGGAGVGPLAELAERIVRLPGEPVAVVVCGRSPGGSRLPRRRLASPSACWRPSRSSSARAPERGQALWPAPDAMDAGSVASYGDGCSPLIRHSRHCAGGRPMIRSLRPGC